MAEMSDRARELVDELAREVAGDDMRAYAQTVIALVNVAGDVAETPVELRADHGRQHLSPRRSPAKRAVARRRGLRAAPVAPSTPPVEATIYADATYQENLAYVVRPGRRRIVGGRPTREFPDCVAVGSRTGWCCSGTLVGPNVVVTAAHCPRDHDCADRVMVGVDTNPSGGGRVLDVAGVHVHEEYVEDGPADLAALVLARDVPNVAPRAIAAREELDAAHTVRLVGFGFTDVGGTHGYGVKREVDVPIASTKPEYGADAALEFVAGKPALERDSCNGDSGGPAYVETSAGWRLGGATSRGIANSIRPCGDGGIYERMHAFEAWLRAIPGARFAT